MSEENDPPDGAMEAYEIAEGYVRRIERERDEAREEVSHLSAALAGDNEGVRLWMLDCGRLVDKHRQHADRYRAALEKLSALNADPAVPRIAREALEG